MDTGGKIKKYQDILIQYLEEEGANPPSNPNGGDYQVIADTVRNHYQLASIGWFGDQYHSSILLHFDIYPDGKIWIQANWTDSLVGQELVQRGVSPKDIVLGFQAPESRKYTAYAEG
jgi:XisI protein